MLVRLDVRLDHDELIFAIRLRSFLLLASDWTAMPSVFAGGNAGIRQLTQTTGWKVVAHNRYWSADTNYAKQNGGNWSFFIDTKAEGNMAV